MNGAGEGNGDEKCVQNGHLLSPLEKLAGQISENSTKISTFLHSTGHAQPSFDRDAPAASIPADSPPEIRTARQQLMEAALKAFQLALGPNEYLPNLALGVSDPILSVRLHFALTFYQVPIRSLSALACPFQHLCQGASRGLHHLHDIGGGSRCFRDPAKVHCSHGDDQQSILRVRAEPYRPYGYLGTIRDEPAVS